MTMKDGKPFRGLIDTLKEENAALRKEVEREKKRHYLFREEAKALRTRIAALKKAGDLMQTAHVDDCECPACSGWRRAKGEGE